MSALAVSSESLSKRYQIPRPGAPGIAQFVRHPAASFAARRTMEVHALRDVTFAVQEGEVFGIVGRNGAGKSTLLKILARITAPSSGRVAMRGRVASLLEVGTGFHPDLTGRENVYLNGMLLGMPQREVDRAFDAICEFAGVGPYINVPIKRYSSGMQLRLAFAVAAHLAADTMIIDEVLAVGDAEFQRKCLGAMRDVSTSGRTTLFVSHNMAAVESLCTRVMWLDKGTVRSVGQPDRVIREYLSSGVSGASLAPARVVLGSAGRGGGFTIGGGHLDAVTFVRAAPDDDRDAWQVSFGERFVLELEYTLERPEPGLVLGIGFRNERGEDVLTSHSCDAGTYSRDEGGLGGVARVEVAAPWLRPGRYTLEMAMISGFQLLDIVSDPVGFVVEEQSAVGAPPIALKKGPVSPVWLWTDADEAVLVRRGDGAKDRE
ncbi:MAG: ABC transporter ATP-binding protein [Gemmatimonadota bacterium]|nr:ABC transporter ATP-binding protein [Gemmatimonadota bacterium]